MNWFIIAQKRKFDPNNPSNVIVWKRPHTNRRGRIVGKGTKKHTYIVEFEEGENKHSEEIHSRNMEKDWKAKPGAI